MVDKQRNGGQQKEKETRRGTRQLKELFVMFSMVEILEEEQKEDHGKAIGEP